MKLFLSIYLILYAFWFTPGSGADEPLLGSNLAGLLDYACAHDPEFAAARL